jgi:hypothetical protein
MRALLMVLALLPPAAATAAWPGVPRPSGELSTAQAGLPGGLYFELTRGQFQSLQGERRERRLLGAPPLTLAGPTRLELGATSSGRLVLPGAFQLDLAGPAVLEVQPPSSADATPHLRLGSLGGALLECRRSGPTLTLPQGQVLHPRRGVLRLTPGASDELRLTLCGGEPLELDLGGRYSFEIPVGFDRALPHRLTPTPATYRGR